MKPFDIFLVAAPKDYGKLPYVIKSIKDHVHGYENMYLTTPKELPKEFYIPISNYPIHYRTDNVVLDFDPYNLDFRKNWVFQQLLKLFQNETKNEWYFVCDTDVVLLKDLPLWEGECPIWYYGLEQYNEPYFRFSQKMFGYGRIASHTFIGDLFFFNKKLVSEMLNSGGYDKERFLDKCALITDRYCHPSEAELYMNYLSKVGMPYTLKKIKTYTKPKIFKDPIKQAWTADEIESVINKGRTMDVDAVAIHNWNDNCHNLWGA